MTIQTTLWIPDTCAIPQCIIQYQWDDTVPQEQRTHDNPVFLQRCSIHAAQPGDDSARWTTITEENPRKNQAWQSVIDNGPSSLVDTDVGTGTKTLKAKNPTTGAPLSLDFAFNGTPPNRLLTLTLVGITLTTQQKNNVQTALNTKFGTGKVTFVN